jgi:hypothetical protein
MKKPTILALFLTLTILLSSWTPIAASTGQAQADTAATTGTAGVTLTITNPMPKATVVTLTGANHYTFNVLAGQTRIQTINQGDYRYKYQGCLDKIVSGQLDYKDGKYELNIQPCKMVNLTIINPFFDTYVSEMKGWMNYQITVKARHTKTFSIVAGPYWLSYTCDGKSWTGKVKLRKDKVWIMCN